ncbi:uncharacterized protein F21D5.5-like [Ctenocephalides felis]|uniref:uncharacterized protein F21D5.5-like n=1 Tax=Ctenocephalides felis TaxID=7515 RepID=UPI000E6E4103|nr:uncharacterized protein F21D5.5-like [Ctenocephalides felis]
MLPRSSEDTNGITKKFKTHNVSLQSNVKKGDCNTTLEITQDTWEDVSNGKLLIFTKSGVTASSKIAAYDLDGTLIKTKSGLVFAKNKDDWQIAFKQIPKHLKELETQGYKLVIFTNQAGIGKGKTDPKEFKGKVEAILNKLNVPMQVFISTTKGIYRKPLTGMWKVLTEQKNCGVSVSKADCFYCGDAAGRPDKWALGKKKDFSAADRLMAKNLGIAFYTPEEHFEKAKVVQWNKPGFDPPSLKNLNISRFDPPNAKLIQSEQEVIVLVGCPGSGKSFISKELVQSGYVHVNRDTLGSWQKCVAAMKNALQNGKSVVVDNTNADKESRNRYIVAAGKVKVRCGVMTTSFDHCRHNNIFRELTDKTHKEIKDMILFSYRKNFVEPTLSEGFAEIFKINFIPQFDNKEHEELYYMYLLEK